MIVFISFFNSNVKGVDMDPLEKNILEGITLVHAGTELSSTVITKDRFFEVIIENKKTVVEIESGKANIQYVMPSVEGTVLLCQLIDNTRRFYDTESGQLIEESELRKRNPHFYQ